MSSSNLTTLDSTLCSIFIRKEGVSDADHIGLWAERAFPRKIDTAKEEDVDSLGGKVEVVLFKTREALNAFAAAMRHHGLGNGQSGVAVEMRKPILAGYSFVQILHDTYEVASFSLMKCD